VPSRDPIYFQLMGIYRQVYVPRNKQKTKKELKDTLLFCFLICKIVELLLQLDIFLMKLSLLSFPFYSLFFSKIIFNITVSFDSKENYDVKSNLVFNIFDAKVSEGIVNIFLLLNVILWMLFSSFHLQDFFLNWQKHRIQAKTPTILFRWN
jgi:hypothetical protein